MAARSFPRGVPRVASGCPRKRRVAGLPPAARLRRAADFAALRTASGRTRSRLFALRWGSSPAGVTRLGLAVSRKVSKRAVIRNRIKRIIRESFRAHREALPAVDIIVIAQPPAAGTAAHALRQDLDQAWSRVRALKHSPAPGTIVG